MRKDVCGSVSDTREVRRRNLKRLCLCEESVLTLEPKSDHTAVGQHLCKLLDSFIPNSSIYTDIENSEQRAFWTRPKTRRASSAPPLTREINHPALSFLDLSHSTAQLRKGHWSSLLVVLLLVQSNTHTSSRDQSRTFSVVNPDGDL